ncbi:zinc-binding alcohol dehydrogenase family protein [Massilia sp. TS11]|uniref:zinc-binding alcohol dehydrogenase family protein n=1 Tax=Massilia sp. TS11 TaxID=2908003 RepID=UPI001EDBD4FA|nr:zinc-binding alcohol dehydrogenase family protein [Massilia sp. TS11]MCG2584422.1 zinc-binding alcohol dehydrogenase family protein [Massilia sp. TS11]
MHAITHDYLQPAHLRDLDLPVPTPGPYDLLVAVKAVSVNPVDNRARRPRPNPPATPRVLGWDAAGVVTAVGAAVRGFRPGERVFYAGDITRPGSFAEYQLVDARLAGHMGARASFEQAAALPLASLTAWEALFERMRVRPGPGRRILIVGAAGGVGSMAVQLAAKVAQLEVIATASRPASAAWVRQLGARHVIDHRADIPAQLAALGMPEVDYVLLAAPTDDYLETMAQVIAPQGTIGTLVEATRPVDWARFWDKSVSLAWTMVFTRSACATADLAEQGRILNEVARLLDDGTLLPVTTEVSSPISAATLEQALDKLAQGTTIGKSVLTGF